MAAYDFVNGCSAVIEMLSLKPNNNVNKIIILFKMCHFSRNTDMLWKYERREYTNQYFPFSKFHYKHKILKGSFPVFYIRFKMSV